MGQQNEREVKQTGPWFVGYQNDYPYVIDRAPKSSNDYPDHDADVAMVAKPFDVRGMSAAEVACLIAAAPDLKQKARALLDRLSADACDEYGLWDECIALQEACNNATGSN